jgi:hypothetical protein
MPLNTLSRPAILMLVLVLAVIGGWEIYLRSKGETISYDDGPPLWADKRAMVYEPSDKATVFIGSSRIKYDLDIDTWEQITGKHAIQLAIEGSSPVPVLIDLGNDKNFAGRLVVDVTEPLFFSGAPPGKRDPDAFVRYYQKRSPTQWAGFKINHVLESQFVFLDKDFLSLNAELDKLPIPNRKGVLFFPLFPKEFEDVNFQRQNKMTPRFLEDTSLPHQVENIWVFILNMGRSAPRPKVDPAIAIVQTVVEAVEKIRARGGEVVFVRTPSSGPFRAAEMGGFPREKRWDPLLLSTHCPGIYFMDYPATDHFICPEWSHLKPSDAILYTKALITELPPSFVQ